MKLLNKRLFSLALLLAVLCFGNAYAQKTGADAVLGTWVTGTGKGHVEIYKQGNQYFGKIVWLKEPNTDQGTPKVDKNNPDPKLRSQPILGLVNLRDFTYGGDNEWEDGKVYDPEKGKDYSCQMTLTDPNTLEVRGYIGISLIGRTDTWTRVK
jgi:uncharacterized protein (DUF2147 family)